MNSYDVLVIYLSVSLGIFIIVGIVLFVSLIKLTKQLRNIADKTESVIEDVESVSSFIKTSTAPAAIMGFVSSIINSVTNRNSNKKGKK